MSDRPHSASLDLDSLAEAFSQLQVAAGALTRALRPSASAQDDEWEVVREEPAAPVGGSEPACTSDPPSGSSASFPFRFRPAPRPPPARSPDLLPEDLLSFVSSLAPAVRKERGQRAWSAGLCAGAVLRGERDVVDPTLELRVRNRIYVVLRNPRGSSPSVYHPFGEFKAAVGRLLSGTVCHGWPTEGEARLYCLASGQPFPSA